MHLCVTDSNYTVNKINVFLMVTVVSAWMSNTADAGKSTLHFMSVGHSALDIFPGYPWAIPSTPRILIRGRNYGGTRGTVTLFFRIKRWRIFCISCQQR